MARGSDAAPTPGDAAPTFAAPLVDEAVEPVAFESLLADAPIVLSFSPRRSRGPVRRNSGRSATGQPSSPARAGGSTESASDLPWALSAFRERESLPFGILSDDDGPVRAAYGVRTTYERLGVPGVARRAVFVVDAAGTVTYRWLAPEPSDEPDYDAVVEAVADAA